MPKRALKLFLDMSRLRLGYLMPLLPNRAERLHTYDRQDNATMCSRAL